MTDNKLSERVRKAFKEAGCTDRDPTFEYSISFMGSPEKFLAAARCLLASERLNNGQLWNMGRETLEFIRKNRECIGQIEEGPIDEVFIRGFQNGAISIYQHIFDNETEDPS